MQSLFISLLAFRISIVALALTAAFAFSPPAIAAPSISTGTSNVDGNGNFIASDSAFRLFWDSATDVWGMQYTAPGTAGNAITWSTGFAMNTTGQVGIGDNTPDAAFDVVGDINFTGVIVDVSDIRLKQNIHPLQSPLQKLISLDGFAFEMKNDPAHRVEYGVSAQDVQEVFPELVRKVDSSGTLGVNYNGLIAPMIEAIKELKAENDALKARLETLERRQH